MPTLRSFSLSVLLILLLAACAGGTAEGPPEIRYGEDTCAQCQMIINEARFAAASVSAAGTVRRFDDIGEMFLDSATSEEAVRTFWIHDFHSEAWVKSENATFVHNPDLASPMGWGLAAFAERDKAEAYQVAAGGILLTAEEVATKVAAGELRPAGMSGSPGAEHAHDHGDGDG